MVSTTTLSINGRPGLDFARDREAHLRGLRREQDTSQAPGTPGPNGIDAPPAHGGQPAGFLAVELCRSSTRKGGIRVCVLDQVGSSRLAATTEILPQNKVHFTAVGGQGEPGRHGAPGQRGAAGADGTDATRTTDATNGEQGGVGGIGGLGSNGGDGGTGGILQLWVDENETELLHSVSWDISGGEGGHAGKHGESGQGGPGGRAGKAVIWEDVSHYKYSCTPSCIGATTNALVLHDRGAVSIDVFRRMTEQIGSTSNLNSAMARFSGALQRYENHGPVGGGVCRCKGGASNCSGCDERPVFRTFSKAAGMNGEAGPPGSIRSAQLLPGQKGADGTIEIMIKHKNGDRSTYTSPFRLELVDFDVEDGNADGIFEPGDDIYIRRVLVKNNGGMPSPCIDIPCQVLSSDLVVAGSGKEGWAPIQKSIPAGNAESTEHEIRASIERPSISARSIPPYSSQQTICLQATMPWLEQALRDFDASRIITVQYPIELRSLSFPKALAPMYRSKLKWQIFNKSSRAFGTATEAGRIAKVLILVDSKQGELFNPQGEWVSSLEVTIPRTSSQSSVEMNQRFRVKSSARAYSALDISLQLFVSPPKVHLHVEDAPLAKLQLIESHKVSIQVAPGHRPSKEDDVLLVTNPSTKQTEIEALYRFLVQELGLKTNIWNIGVHGGLLVKDQEDEETVSSVLDAYHGKCVILLGNVFELFADGQLTVLDVCDTTSIFECCNAGTCFLFLGSNNDDKSRRMLRRLTLGMLGDAHSKARDLPAAYRFNKQEELVSSLQHTTKHLSRCQSLSIKKSVLKTCINLTKAAEKLAKVLEAQVPQTHFVVCPVPGDKNAGEGELLVWCGMPRAAHMYATTTDFFQSSAVTSRTVSSSIDLTRRATRIGKATSTLTTYDKICIISAVPIRERLCLLDRSSLTMETTKLVELSLKVQLDREIQRFLSRAEWMRSIRGRGDYVLRESIPSVQALIDSFMGETTKPPSLERVLVSCMASCLPQGTGQAISHSAVPFGHARKQLFNMISGRLPRPTRSPITRPWKLARLSSQGDTYKAPAGTEEPTSVEGDSPSGRSVASWLAKTVTDLTGTSEHFQARALYGAEQMLEHNLVLSMEELAQEARNSVATEERVLEIYNKFEAEQEKYAVAEDDERMKQSSG